MSNWNPSTQAVVAVFVIGGLLGLTHLISVKVNAGGSLN